MNSVFDMPRYQGNPVFLLFEKYILSTLGQLSEDEERELEALDLGVRLSGEDAPWKSVVREMLELSDTIDIAIADEWYRAQDISEGSGIPTHPLDFAQDFVDTFYEEGSTLDKWEEGELEAAQTRIHIRKSILEN